jgi:hypothetical protein
MAGMAPQRRVAVDAPKQQPASRSMRALGLIVFVAAAVTACWGIASVEHAHLAAVLPSLLSAHPVTVFPAQTAEASAASSDTKEADMVVSPPDLVGAPFMAPGGVKMAAMRSLEPNQVLPSTSQPGLERLPVPAGRRQPMPSDPLPQNRLLLATHSRLMWYFPDTDESLILHEGEVCGSGCLSVSFLGAQQPK